MAKFKASRSDSSLSFVSSPSSSSCLRREGQDLSHVGEKPFDDRALITIVRVGPGFKHRTGEDNGRGWGRAAPMPATTAAAAWVSVNAFVLTDMVAGTRYSLDPTRSNGVVQ